MGWTLLKSSNRWIAFWLLSQTINALSTYLEYTVISLIACLNTVFSRYPTKISAKIGPNELSIATPSTWRNMVLLNQNWTSFGHTNSFLNAGTDKGGRSQFRKVISVVSKVVSWSRRMLHQKKPRTYRQYSYDLVCQQIAMNLLMYMFLILFEFICLKSQLFI